ncbi:MAG: hypothetical protein J3K34DRAFT_523026 [Monoraphidium minutum]|nr:MAG: hypothetical protein J3K34DRAFT_523026 [Monoraphidium minutum]
MARSWAILAVLAVAAVTVSAQKSGVESVTGGPIYTLPRDHALHTEQPLYKMSNDFMEWFYFTSFCKDVNTGEPVTVFWVLNLQGYIKKTAQPFNSILFSGHNMDTGFFQNTLDKPATIKTTGTGPGVGDKFMFTYTMEDEFSRANITYVHKDETWYFKASSTNTQGDNQPYDLDLKLKIYSPGYIGATAQGVETEGYNPTGDWNPQSMYGLSYYTIAPQALITGEVKMGDGKQRTIRGAAWMEHQWGNFRGYSNLHSRYYWAWGRLDNGDLLTLREWRTKDAADVNNGPPDRTQSRFIYLKKLPDNKGFHTLYATGPAMNFTPAKYHKIANGQSFPLWGKLATPQGTFYIAPEFKDQAALTAAGPYFFEGVTYIYKDKELKQRVGRMFSEHVEIANKKFDFVRQAPERGFARPLDGGLPPLPEDVAKAVYPSRPLKVDATPFKA